MKVYLVCGLNDENYTSPYFEICETLEQAKEICINNVLMHEKTVSLNDDVSKFMKFETMVNSYRYDYADDTEENFFVNEIIEIDIPNNENEATYLCIWHHAYNGVDFEVKIIGTYEECYSYMQNEIDKELTSYDTSKLEYDNPTEACVDTSDEWFVWNIIRV